MELAGDIMIAALAGGVIGLDRTAAGQFMVSQPIVAGPLTGLILGDVMAGLLIGALLELIWVMDVPVGTFVPANQTVAAVATAIAVIGSGGSAPLSAIGFVLLLTVAMSPLTMIVETAMRKGNARLGTSLFASSGRPAAAALSRAHLAGLALFFAKSFLLCLVLVPAGLLALEAFERLPAVFHEAMMLFVKLLPLLGVASIARKLSIRIFDRFLVGGFLLAAVLGLAFAVSPAVIILLAVAAGWMGVRFHG